MNKRARDWRRLLEPSPRGIAQSRRLVLRGVLPGRNLRWLSQVDHLVAGGNFKELRFRLAQRDVGDLKILLCGEPRVLPLGYEIDAQLRGIPEFFPLQNWGFVADGLCFDESCLAGANRFKTGDVLCTEILDGRSARRARGRSGCARDRKIRSEKLFQAADVVGSSANVTFV